MLSIFVQKGDFLAPSRTVYKNTSFGTTLLMDRIINNLLMILCMDARDEKIASLVESVYNKNTLDNNKKKEVFSEIEHFISSLRDYLDKEHVRAEVMLGGSAAKGTFTGSNFDADVFVRFDYKRYKDFSHELSDILSKPLMDMTDGKARRVHGSRDYFDYKSPDNGKINFEIIPVLKIDHPSKALNITDCSPFHVFWMKDVLSRDESLIKEIVATKLFMKAQGLYGAESYIKGFSGHVIDLLVSYYKSFSRLVKSASSWGDRNVIDVAGHYSSTEKAIKKLDESKISPLIVIDPIQKERNAAAALSKEKKELFKKVCSSFLSSPKISFFRRRKFSLKRLKEERIPGCEKVILKVDPLKKKKDIAGSKMLKFFERLCNEVSSNDFEIYDKGWEWPSRYAYIWIYVTKESVKAVKGSPKVIKMGPPISSKAHVSRFKEMHPDSYEHDGRLYAEVPRRFMTYNQIIRKTIKEAKQKKEIEEILVVG